MLILFENQGAWRALTLIYSIRAYNVAKIVKAWLYSGMMQSALKRKYERLKAIYNSAIALCFYLFICRVCRYSRLNAV